MQKRRLDSDLPVSTGEWGWKFHHVGIPTDQVMPGEKYLPQLKIYVSGFDISPFGIEWMRFEKDSHVHRLVQTVPHVAFVVDDLEFELRNRNLKIITKPNQPSDGVKVAMIEHMGAPVELMEFTGL
ncbi:MAG: hypothetical protein RBS55_00960 [Bacteroidales bacterium]|jgi:hypothetical protein|nr:hypothetical protein [Bacteroidales bacterium]